MLKSVLLVTGHTARTSEAYLEAGQPRRHIYTYIPVASRTNSLLLGDWRWAKVCTAQGKLTHLRAVSITYTGRGRGSFKPLQTTFMISYQQSSSADHISRAPEAPFVHQVPASTCSHSQRIAGVHLDCQIIRFPLSASPSLWRGTKRFWVQAPSNRACSQYLPSGGTSQSHWPQAGWCFLWLFSPNI